MRLLLVAVLAVLLAACSRPAQDGALRLSGTVESVQVDVASQIPGRVEAIPEEGAAVKRGELLVRLDAREYLDRVKQAEAALEVARVAVRQARLTAQYRDQSTRATVEAAAAALETSETRVDELRHQRDLEADRSTAGVAQAEAGLLAARKALTQAEAALREATSRADLARRDLQRDEQLLRQGFIPPQRVDQRRTAVATARQQVLQARAARDQAGAQVEAARAVLAQARAQHSAVLAREAQVSEARSSVEQARAQYEAARSEDVRVQAAREDVVGALARLREAEAALALARTQASHATITSPLDGLVSEKIVQAGEQITPGQPLLRVARLDRVWVDVYVPEDRLQAVWLGMRATIHVDTASGPAQTMPGRLTFISPEAEFTPKNVQTQEERTTLVYRTKISAENPRQWLKPGMPVDVDLDVNQQRPAEATPASPGKIE